MAEPREVILLIEDDPNDVSLVQIAFRSLDQRYCLVPFYDARLAIEYLEGRGSYTDREAFPVPRLVLLDLKMPDLDGFEFLRWLRQQPATIASLPVAVLAGSHFSPDIRRAYHEGADTFITKPHQASHLLKDLSAVLEYWAPIGRPSRGFTVGERSGTS